MMRRYSVARALFANPLSLIGLLIWGALALGAVLAPWLSPYSMGDVFAPMLPPSADHPLGTNDLGYDLWTELLQGARFSLLLSALAATGSTALGLMLGLVAGYFERAGFVILRVVDVFLSVPRFVLIVLMAAFVRPGFGALLVFFILFGWPAVTRVIYAHVRGERQCEYVEAARLIGAGDIHILRKHLLPASLPIAFVRLVSEMQHVIMAESGLSFLGLGDPTAQSWGMTAAHAMRYPALLLTDVWRWWMLPPGMAITLTCTALVLVGLTLDRLANPRLR
ncbi:MAG TPA: ABC transporter permease [Chloroflexi bacterium]|jgi:peptide/nickel transport system permease protein|nr:ABC transporter permease [Chloroflexota bacterium]